MAFCRNCLHCASRRKNNVNGLNCLYKSIWECEIIIPILCVNIIDKGRIEFVAYFCVATQLDYFQLTHHVALLLRIFQAFLFLVTYLSSDIVAGQTLITRAVTHYPIFLYPYLSFLIYLLSYGLFAWNVIVVRRFMFIFLFSFEFVLPKVSY